MDDSTECSWFMAIRGNPRFKSSARHNKPTQAESTQHKRGQNKDSAGPEMTKARLFRPGFSASKQMIHLDVLAEWTGLEPATPGVTGRYSNQLNYHSR